MDATVSRQLVELQSVIGHRFACPALLVEAMTHRSFVNENPGRQETDNQRLEFFGDAILDFSVSGLLFRRFPESREGELTRLRARLVDEENLARMAAHIGLGACLRLGRGEERDNGRSKASLLADAYEALLAAVYLDGGMPAIEALVGAQFSPLLEEAALTGLRDDYKTSLQELAQNMFGEPPTYRVTGESGPPHQRIYAVAAIIGGETIGVGEGRSKKVAEQAAARDALEKLKERETLDVRRQT